MIQGFDHFNLEQIACWRQEGLNPRLYFCTLSHPQKWLISALAERQAWLFRLRKKKKIDVWEPSERQRWVDAGRQYLALL